MTPRSTNIDRWDHYYQSEEYRLYLAHALDVSKKPFKFDTKLLIPNFLFIIVFNAVSIYSFITFPYREQVFLLIWAYIVAHLSILGVSAGAHRLWSHRSYKANASLRIFLAICYYMTGWQKIFTWVKNHRAHHMSLNTDADPYNSFRGFWFSHLGWLVMEPKPEVQKLKAKIDARDVADEHIVQFFDGNFYLMTALFSFVLPIFIPVYFFNQSLQWTIVSQVFMRYPFVLHATWSVNSFAHLLGNCSYNKYILPGENSVVSLMALGEGWQNFHHVFPSDYRSSELQNFNPTTTWIHIFAKLGLAHDLKTVSIEEIKEMVSIKGDNTHPVYTNPNSPMDAAKKQIAKIFGAKTT